MSKYIPERHSLEFIAFIRACANEENSNPESHYKIADALFSSKKEDRKLLIECTRGMGKSTLVEYACIYAATLGEWPGFGKVPFILFLGASMEGNVKQFFKNITSKVDRSPFISKYLTIKRSTDSEVEFINSSGVEIVITGRGMGTNFRGVRSKSGNRPTMVIADDVLSNEMMTSDVLRKTVDTNWYNSVLPALNPTKHKIIFIGTPISEADLLSQLRESKAYHIARFPICEKFPPDSKKDFKSVWPDRFSYSYINEMYKQYESAGMLQSFYQEFMLEMTDLSTLLVDVDKDVKWFEPATILANKGNYNFYITTDFATSQKASADFSTLGVWAINSNGDWMLVDGYCKRQEMPKNIDEVFRYAQRYKPISVGIETSGQQGGFLDWVQNEMPKRNIFFSLACKIGSNTPGIRPTSDKLQRFVTGVQARFKQGKIWLPKLEVVKTTNIQLHALTDELIKELRRLTLAGGVKALKHDDALDLLNQLSEIEIYIPSSTTEYNYNTVDNVWEEEDEVSSQSTYVF